MNQLFLSISPPLVGGLNGTMRLRSIDAREVNRLLNDTGRKVISLIAYLATVDVLNTIGGISSLRTYNKERESVDMLMRDGDAWLQVRLLPGRSKKSQESIGVYDFEFTLCEYQEATK